MHYSWPIKFSPDLNSAPHLREGEVTKPRLREYVMSIKAFSRANKGTILIPFGILRLVASTSRILGLTRKDSADKG